MAAPLKDSLGPEVVAQIAASLAEVQPGLNRERFTRTALSGLTDLELTARARQIAAAMADVLPRDPSVSIPLLTEALGPPPAQNRRVAADSFYYLPFSEFIAVHGLTCFEASMRAQYLLTQHFTAEFCIRPFLRVHQDRTIARLHDWVVDPNEHVRRLVSEGTRPRLPWAGRLSMFQSDPTPITPLLAALKDDPSEYVRRSVANSLNDIAKDNPQVTLEIAGTWWVDGDANRRRLVRHGLRTLVKAGDPQALAILGYAPNPQVEIQTFDVVPGRVRIGDTIRLTAVVGNRDSSRNSALVDFEVHFVKASGATSPKVFKGARIEIPPREQRTVSKSISLRQHSTRRHYPGRHSVTVKLNGLAGPSQAFEVAGPSQAFEVTDPGVLRVEDEY